MLKFLATVSCSNAKGLHKTVQLHFLQRHSWSHGARSKQVTGVMAVCVTRWMGRNDISFNGLLYSEALHRQKKALFCHVLGAIAMCFHVFNIIEQEGIQCVGRILQLLSLFMYKLVLPSSFRQQMVLPPLWKQTQTSL